ncbi:MAG: sugar phosphate nucleotidyltransferase [Clostridia bacterium]
MKKPILVILAAGMGSRFGGLKQIIPVGPNGEVIMDYSLFDAKKAGFEKVVFIIKKAIEKDFKEVIGNRIEKIMEVEYAYQELDILPAGFSVPEGREKPFGTSHAVLCAKEYIDAPFAIINADDYYGAEGFAKIYDFLSKMDQNSFEYGMVGYQIENTVTDNGTVTRGVCNANENNHLSYIVETSNIEKTETGARERLNENEYQTIEKGTLVSMNFWGFNRNFLDVLETSFPEFLVSKLPLNPQKMEFLLPNSVQDLIERKIGTVEVIPCSDIWWGITYKEDTNSVVEAISRMHTEGKYPTPLWK